MIIITKRSSFGSFIKMKGQHLWIKLKRDEELSLKNVSFFKFGSVVCSLKLNDNNNNSGTDTAPQMPFSAAGK